MKTHRTTGANEIFLTLVETHFAFLINDYGFSITQRNMSSKNPIAFGKCIFSKPEKKESSLERNIFVEITLDRGYVDVKFGSSDLREEDWFYLSDIRRVTASESSEARVDYSLTPLDILNPQIIRTADDVNKYCRPFLNGDFSLGDKIKQKREMERRQRISEWWEIRRRQGILSDPYFPETEEERTRPNEV